MKQNRRNFLQCMMGLCAGGLFRHPVFPDSFISQSPSQDQFKSLLIGSWKLQSYTYTSNKKTYSSPKEIEATANFTETQYDVKFSTYITRVGIKRTRHASESGTFSLSEDRIRLIAEEASDEKEKGEELLTEVRIEDNTMTLKSNNGSNHEIWKRNPPPLEGRQPRPP